MEVHVHANCQAIPIAGMLQEANPGWHVTWFEVHGQEIVDRLQEHILRIKTADLIVTQPIHRGYRNTEELSIDWIRDNVRSDATLLVFPSMHFAGHHPGLDGLPLPGLPMLSNLITAHLIATGCAPTVAAKYMLSDDLFRETEIETEIKDSIAETDRRETTDHIDIKISPFLKKNCHVKSLFHIYNHPFRETAAFIANQVLERLGADDRVSIEGRDYQPDTHIPPLHSVARYLELRIGNAARPERDEIVRMPGHAPMAQHEYYGRMAEQLATFSSAELFDAIKGRWPTVQVLQRLAAQKSSLPGIERWLQP